MEVKVKHVSSYLAQIGAVDLLNLLSCYSSSFYRLLLVKLGQIDELIIYSAMLSFLTDCCLDHF